MQLTPHFTSEELLYTSELAYMGHQEEILQEEPGKLYMLAGFAERVREIVGAPLIVTSAYRCKMLNSIIGGSPTSQHALCEAIDFVPKGRDLNKAAIDIMCSDLKYGQLIIENSKGNRWLHISIGGKRENLAYNNGKYSLLTSSRDVLENAKKVSSCSTK